MDKTSRRKYWRQWDSRMKIHEQEGGGYVWGEIQESVGSDCLGQKVSAELKGVCTII